MKELKKTKFENWQVFSDSGDFMFQGVLLLVSAVFSCLAYALTVYLFLNYGDYVFDSYISNGEIIASIVGPVFWSAVIASTAILLMIILSHPMKRLVRKWMRDDKDSVRIDEVTPRDLRRKIEKLMAVQYSFYFFIYVVWLYASVVFSFLFLNGVVRYAIIFVSLTFLTYFAKKFFCYPIFCIRCFYFARAINKRNAEYLSLVTNEGSRSINVTETILADKEYPHITRVIKSAARASGLSVDEIKVVMGCGLEAEETRPKLIRLRIGISLLSVLTEDELGCFVEYELRRTADPLFGTYRRYILFILSLRFSVSEWNPLERVYAPITVLANENKHMQRIANLMLSHNMRAEEYRRRAGDERYIHCANAAVKQWLFRKTPFAANKELLDYLMSESSPRPDYQARIIKEFCRFFSKNREHILDTLKSLSENAWTDCPFSVGAVSELASLGLIDVCSFSSGEFLAELEALKASFDKAFMLCAAIDYPRHKKLCYTRPRETVKTYERDRLLGLSASETEAFRAAESYISLYMPREALSLISDFPKPTPKSLTLLKGIAEMMLLDTSGAELVLRNWTPDSRLNARLTDTLLMFASLSAKGTDYDKLFERRSYVQMHEGGLVLRQGMLWHMNSLTGFPILKNRFTESDFPTALRKELSEKIFEFCGDRFIYAAVIKEKSSGENILIISCEEPPRGCYTTMYRGCVYNESGSFGELLDSCVDYRGIKLNVVYAPDMPVDVFDKMPNAILTTKGKIAAETILREAAEAQRQEIEDADFDGFEHDDGEKPE